MSDGYQISHGIPEGQNAQAVQLYWSAFSGKLGKVMGPPERACMFLENALDTSHAICAVDTNTGQLVGIAGFKTPDGALIGGDFRDVVRVYGWLGALWRAPLLDLLERDIEPDTLLMDGIMVAASERGRGVGTALLSAIKDYATSVGYAAVRLDVIDTNPRARALYERQGFVAQQTSRIGPLSLVFGFNSSTRMVWQTP